MPENNGISREEALRKMFIRRVLLIALFIIIAVSVISIAFNQFKIYSDARLALREAKNIKMTLEMADLELYSAGISIFDETSEGNLRKSTLSYVNKMQGETKGEIKLTGYDTAKHKITGFEYELEKYIVRYKSSDDDDSWQVFRIKELLTY
ncbi:MAG: hypothetical protein IKW90_03485 [Lachnospiraceae bacterium]|nr:hypothetical protein [Lachnospiraceae bacterium]